MANLVVATLSRMIEQAIAWGVAGEMTNPCRSAPKYRTRRRERFLTDVEFRRLRIRPWMSSRRSGVSRPMPLRRCGC